MLAQREWRFSNGPRWAKQNLSYPLMKSLIFILALALLFGCYSNALAQTTTQSSDVIKELLAAPAPTPRVAETPTEIKEQRPPEFFLTTNVPPDDAPLDDLLEYWRHWAGNNSKHRPSTTVSQRLLDASVDDLQKLSELLQLFPSSEYFTEKIKQAFDKATSNPKLESQRGEIKKWLTFNSKYFIGELVAMANKVEDKDKTGSIENEPALVALAKVDWSMAEPILETLAKTGPQRSATLALTLLYQHSIEEKNTEAESTLRSKLQAIASDRSFPGRARDDAIEALSVSEWAGRDEWYLSLFNDESLTLLKDGYYGFSSLSTLFTSDADKWIPVMTKLVAGKDRVAQQNAASCLVRYANWHPRRDVILPVLRWLSEPDWIPISSTERAWFMQKMNQLDIPESIPGLIWIVENDKEHARWAASTLAYYKDARAIPALKNALAEADEDGRPPILEGLIASGGITEAEQVKAIEAYATMLTTEEGRQEAERYRGYGDKGLPLPVSIGRYLARLPNPPDNLVRAVLAQAASLRTKNPALSRSLTETANRWQGRQVDLELVRKIAENTAEADTILAALKRRADLRKSVAAELHSLIAAGGVPKGIAAVLLEDNDITATILSSSDQPAQIASLASARLTQTPLSIELVGRLLKNKNSLLATAAERYLLAEDSKEAQTLLWQHHPGEAFITGWRENIELMGGSNFAQIAKQEDQLRAELRKPGGPLEILALLSNSDDDSQVLRIYADKAVYTHYEDSSRYRERVVPQSELSIFKEFLATKRIADSGPEIQECHYGCWISQFLQLSKASGRRVFSQSGMNIGTVSKNLRRLGDGEGATTRYNLEKEIKGLEVLFADQRFTVLDVWQSGNDIRIFVERLETEDEIENRIKNDTYTEDENARAERWHKEYLTSRTRFSWRSLKDKDASSITSVPDGYSTFDDTRFPYDEEDDSARRSERQVQVLSPDSILIARNFEGLWKQVAGTKAVRISGENGAYANPIVTPDGKWAVISKTDSDWGKPNYLVRLNLETGRESRVALAPAAQLDPIVYLPLHNKILLRRAQDETDEESGKPVGPDEFYLIDPKTGKVESISGEFAPLGEEGKRFLQSTGEAGQYWAAIPDETKNQTVVGRYNLKDFSFKPVLTVPQILFASTAMWVDEKQGKLYLVYKNQLLRLPLKSTP